ncbi:hypothetical protein MKK69_01290 [Methylobacterium sp. J-026]|uniref:hypothetical protein n=1 Tax=Methylobacterium sp. J-026 TaxID=2836624 RepID=UPI001FBC092A|nr:hypothetical protein [Methylobacterium sp. J-026]MCJ2132713.1 hypothetical protein [Methylobacterium sp. J-026]
MAAYTHPSFQEPEGSTKIWRYLTTAKFINMIQTRTLWFSRSDLLGDPFEGSVTLPMYRGPLTPEDDKNQRLIMRNSIYINCWHMNERESAAMWGLYAPHTDSIAIVTQYRMLRDLLPNFVFSGMVKYIDYDKDKIGGNVLDVFLHKRFSFAHEMELRAVLWDGLDFREKMSKAYGGNLSSDAPPQEALTTRSYVNSVGAAVPVDISNLVEKLYISPTSPDWYKEAIEQLCKTYGLKWGVEKSSLSARALF